MSPSPSTDEASPSSPTSVPNALFLQPKTPPPTATPDSSLQTSPGPYPSSSSSPSPSPGPSPADAGPIWSPDADAAPIDRPSESSDTPSTGGSPVSKAGLKAVIGSAVKTVTNAVAVIASDSYEQEYGLWRADADDIEGIAAPASRILYRRLPDEAKGTDTLDLFGMALAVAGYLAKHLRLKAGLKQLRALDHGPAEQPAPGTP
jgi:hypothetical protein